MLRPSNERTDIYLCVEPIDMRKQIDGLSVVIQASLGLDPFSEALYVFTNRRRTHCRILYWEGSGFVMWTKRLEKERFHWPRGEGTTVALDGQSLNFLLDGFDLSRWRPHRRLHYDFVA